MGQVGVEFGLAREHGCQMEDVRRRVLEEDLSESVGVEDTADDRFVALCLDRIGKIDQVQCDDVEIQRAQFGDQQVPHLAARSGHECRLFRHTSRSSRR